MKGNEEATARALQELLQKLGIECSWIPVAPPKEFPDFDFTISAPELNIATQRWAVECTDLHQYLDYNGAEFSRLSVDRRLESFCERIRTKARPAPNREYHISAFGPDFQIDSKEVERRAIEYLNSGKTEIEALDVPSIDHPDPRVVEVLTKIAQEKACVHIRAYLKEAPITYVTGLGDGIYNADRKAIAPDLMATLRYGMTRILEAKLPKLKQCTDYDKRILAIWRGYWVAEPRDVAEALTGLTLDPESVDTILLVLPGGEVQWVADPGKLFT